jgi:Excalibur calcium-binding domain
VPLYPPDVDCDDVGTTVYVTGDDPHRLDRDGDGVACEAY